MALRAALLSLAFLTTNLLSGQTPASTQTLASPTAQGQSAAPVIRATSPSATLQPTLDILKQAMAGIIVDKWKASPAIRTEASSNLKSVQRDMQTTLPELLSVADAAPDSPAKTLPVFRNVDALYDVVLRLDAAGRLGAPRDQVSALDQALSSLSDVRRSLGDQLQSSAESQDARLVRLQAQLRAIPAPAPAPAPVACTPAPTKKKRPAAKSSN